MANSKALVSTQELPVTGGRISLTVDSATTLEMKYNETQGFVEVASLTTGQWIDDIPAGIMKATFSGTATLSYIRGFA